MQTDKDRDDGSNSSHCLFYLFNEQSATRFSALAFTQRPVHQWGNSTQSPPASDSDLNRAVFKAEAPLYIYVYCLCVHAEEPPTPQQMTSKSNTSLSVPFSLDGWIREVEREWMNNWNYKEFKVGVGGLMRVREEEVDGWKGGWMELTFSSPTSNVAIRCRFGCIFFPSFAAFLSFFVCPPPFYPHTSFSFCPHPTLPYSLVFPLFLITSHPLDNPYLPLSVVNLLLTFSSGSLWLCMCDNLTRLCVCWIEGDGFLPESWKTAWIPGGSLAAETCWWLARPGSPS